MRNVWAIAAGVLAIVIGVGLLFVPISPPLVPFITALTWGAVVICGASAFLAFLYLLASRGIRCLGQDEQLRVVHFTDTTAHNGPGMKLINPFGYRSAEVVKAEILGTMDYVKIIDIVTAAERIERGPRLLFLGPHEKASSRGRGTSLGNADCILVEDQMSGEKRVVTGPCVWFPQPHESILPCSSVSMNRTEYIVVEDGLSGNLSIVKGPRVWFPGPYDRPSAKKTAITLQDDDYVRLRDTACGQRWVMKGKALLFLEPTWQIEDAGPSKSGVKKAWVLKAHEYIRLLDVTTGQVTVHRGEARIFPGPDDQLLDGAVQKAVELDGEHAALVRDKGTGHVRLVTEGQLFVPGPNEEIQEVRELIKLTDNEAMIIKDKDGQYQYYYGNDNMRQSGQPRAFFLPPYAEIVKVWWSRGPRRERKDVSFERFDCRPHFMKFEFDCRTADNVELVLEGVSFWELVDLPLMWQYTGDTTGDMVYHIRSQFIHRVARVTLKKFMEDLHEIAAEVLREDHEFYAARGIKVHALEMTRYQCSDANTGEILAQIIQETTSRMNRLSQAESENEVSIFRTQGQLEQSQLNSDLVKIQLEQSKQEANVAGIAEADRVVTFLEGLEKQVPQLEDRIKMWQVLRKTEALSVVTKGSANLYFTPNDCDLSIDTKAITHSTSQLP